MVTCHVHPEREAHALCVNCGRPACQDCAVTLRGQEWCRTCVEERLLPPASAPAPPPAPAPSAPVPPAPSAPPASAPEAPDPARFSGRHALVVTVLALFPGLGHLYLGLYTRGAQIMVTFVGGLILLEQLRLDPSFPWVVFLAIFFSVFDVREAMDRLRQGRNGSDRPLWDMDRLRGQERLIAYVLLFLGGLALFRAILDPAILGPEYWRYRNFFDRSIFALVLIAAGAWLLRRSSGHRPPPA